MTTALPAITGLADLAGRYDAVLSDVWGVVHNGISAFPSVHVGLIAMNALFVAERSRMLGRVAWLYVVLIVASSVYLGWHYAIDGYVSILVVVLAHKAGRRLSVFRRNQLGPGDVHGAQPV